MLEKRDLQLVRLAVRRKWLTAEEGEDCLFLKRKLGERYTIEEVIRKRGYLDDEALAELTTDADRLTRRRPAPVATTKTPPRPPMPAPRPPAPPPPAPPPPAPRAALPAAQPKKAPDLRPPISVPPSARSARDRETTVLGAEEISGIGDLGDAQIASEFDERTSFDLAGGMRLARSAPSGAEALRPPETPAEESTVLGLAAISVVPPQGERPASFPPAEERTIVGIRIEDVMRERHRNATERPSNPPSADLSQRLRPSLPPVTVRPSRAPIEAPSNTRPVSLRGWSDPDQERPTGPGGYAPLPLPSAPEPTPAAPRRMRSSRLPAPLPPRDNDDALLGEHGGWNLRRVIGRGSTAVVYLAEPTHGVGGPVALKLLKTELVSSHESLERFRREAAAAAKISSPHVVPLRGSGQIGQRPFIALEYVDGFTLRERLDADEPPALAEALRITRDVALALLAAERAGIVHRDVKPENVIVRSTGEVYLADFGLAKEITDAPDGGLTSVSDTIVGTPNYMAPEQAIGATVDQRTDLYGLGATLFHVLVGRPPFPGRSSVSIISKHVRAPVPDVVAIDPRIPPEVAAIIQRLMAKVPSDRYASALDLVEAIEMLLATLAPEQVKVERVVAPAVISSFAVTAALTTLALGAAIALRNGGFAAWGNAENIGVETAAGGATLIILAMLMLGAIGLVRRGELPLPGSTSWLVTVKDATGVVGAGFVLASAALGPPALLDVVVLALGTLVLGSWVFGFFLRTAIARQRKDRGGHVLALFGDIRLRRWRRVHVPMLLSLAGLASVRFAVLAYFNASS